MWMTAAAVKDLEDLIDFYMCFKRHAARKTLWHVVYSMVFIGDIKHMKVCGKG